MRFSSVFVFALAQVAMSAPVSSPTGTLTLAPTGSTPSGYVQASGTNFVANGQKINLRGVNLGGWRVIENWMCGITDSKDDSGNQPGRNSRKTLTDRFGDDQTGDLLHVWEANFIVEEDFAKIKKLGFNVVRLGFSYLTLQYEDGSWRSDAFDLLDWAIKQAKANDLYVILSFHIWETIFQDYSLISENSDDGANARQKAQDIWQYVAKHYLGESTIAAFDVMNEPTGSYANNLQQSLYSGVRSVDPDRVIILESFDGSMSQYNFKQAAYSFHNYEMKDGDTQANENNWPDVQQKAQNLLNNGAPVYIGEYRANDETLKFLLQHMNDMDLSYSMWTYKAVDQGDWAFYNFPSETRVDINKDDYATIMSAWKGMATKPAAPNTGLMGQYGISAS